MGQTIPAQNLRPPHDANRLGMIYEHEAAHLPWRGRICDAHVHLNSLAAARSFFAVADLFGIDKVWSQTPLHEVEGIRAEFGDRVEFVTVPNYAARDKPETFTTDWLQTIEKMRGQGTRMIKFWAAPRGRDFHPTLQLDHPIRLQAMKLARDMGYQLFVTHVGDPDTWFATMYKDQHRYGSKPSQYDPLRRVLEEFHDVKWLAAHMAGLPEHLDQLQELLDAYPHLYVDTSATKWMVRELSKKPQELRDFIQRNPNRVLFGTDIVSSPGDMNLTAEMRADLYASRFWAMRTLWETDYIGPSPIVDPDLNMVDPTVSKLATAKLQGIALEPTQLAMLYRGAAENLLPSRK